MEVASPVNPTDFDFNASAYANAPSTPRFMGDYHLSAPTSPTRITHDLYSQFEELILAEPDESHRTNYSLATVPFAWEEKPGVPKSNTKFFDQDFAFDVSGELHRDSSVAAEDIFDGGVIKPADLEHEHEHVHEHVHVQQPPTPAAAVRQRGRELRSASGLASSRSRRTRSLPPFRGSELKSTTTTTTTVTTGAQEPSSCTTLSVFGSRKWSFKDLFLFRSASDGRAMAKDPFKKYSSIFRKHDEDVRNSSLRHRSGSGSGSGSGSSKRRVPRVSAHELHYTVNRAVSIDMKKQTFLPYKQGILGRLAFNPTVHALSNGFGHSHNYLEMD